MTALLSIFPSGLRRMHAIGAALALLVASSLATPSPAQANPGYLGVQLQDLDQTLLLALDLEDVDDGVLVSEVMPESPAAEAGLERGDVLLRLDGDDIRSARGLTRRIGRIEPGTKVKLDLVRQGNRRTVEVTLGERASRDRSGDGAMMAPDVRVFGFDEDGGAFRALRLGMLGGPRLGVRAEPLNPELGRYFGNDAGLLVLDVEEETPAAEAGLRIGDVIVTVDGETVTDVEELRELLGEHEDGDEVRLGIVRERERQELTAVVEIPDRFEFSGRDGVPGLRWFDGEDAELFIHPGPHGLGRAPRGERWLPRGERRELHRELDDLREEMQRLREELEELRKQ